jgi:DNA repair exonuclease SbcCD nuclease subunit
MAIRLLHTADVHLGRAFGYLGEHARQQHQQRLLRTFERLVETARRQACHAILIVGDLFDSPRIARQWVDRALDLLGSAGMPVVVIPGNHDPAEHHPFQARKLPAQVHFRARAERFALPELDLELIACPAGTAREWGRLLRRDSAGAPFQVALMHGSMPTPDGKGDLTPQMISDSQLDYIALGDWHSPQDFSREGVACWYSGAPEMIMPNQQLPGCALLVELTRGQPARVQPLPVGEAQPPNGNPEFDVSRFPDIDSLIETIRAILTPETVAHIRLFGQWNGTEPLDPLAIQERLQPCCLWLKIEAAFQVGELEPHNPFEQMFATVVAENKAQGKYPADLLDEVLQTGLYLLRGGRL